MLGTFRFPYSSFIGVPAACALLLGAGVVASAQDGYRQSRLHMVDEQIARNGIRNDAVLNAMREVPRHLFVDSKYYADAYRDVIIDIGHKQTLSTAYIVGYMTEAIDPQPTDTVLEIGTGSGYQAAVLSKLVKEVYTIEIVEPLGQEAMERLKKLGYTNVHVKIGDGFKGWSEHAPFNKIIITCSPETVPQPLLDQLAEGGKLIVPLGERYQQAFYLFEKHGSQVQKTKMMPTLFVPMTGIAEENRKVRPDGKHPRIRNGGFEASTDGLPDDWFYVRQGTVEHKGSPEGKSYLEFSNSETGRDAHALQAVGIDGKRIRAVRLSLLVRVEYTRPGGETWERPGLAIRFFDSQNRPIGEQLIGPWLGTFNWRRLSKEMLVPREAAMAMIQIGLRGSTGKLCVDDVRLTPYYR
jgi:protein-L-isoaspartate(D-aspartate) O-methyltransferase